MEERLHEYPEDTKSQITNYNVLTGFHGGHDSVASGSQRDLRNARFSTYKFKNKYLDSERAPINRQSTILVDKVISKFDIIGG